MSTQLEKPPSGGVTLDRAGSGGTGTVCQHSGPYKCGTHGDLIVSFQSGQQFPACPIPLDTKKTSAAGHSTTWAMVREADSTSFDIMVQRGGIEAA